MVCRRTLRWMGHVLRMDEDRLQRQVFDCSLTRSVAEDGSMEQLKLRPGHRHIKGFSGMYSSAMRGCHEEGSGEIRAAAAERAVDRLACRDAIKNLAPLQFKKPEQVGRVTRSCARRGGSGLRCAALPIVQPGSRGVLRHGSRCVQKSQCKEWKVKRVCGAGRQRRVCASLEMGLLPRTAVFTTLRRGTERAGRVGSRESEWAGRIGSRESEWAGRVGSRGSEWAGRVGSRKANGLAGLEAGEANGLTGCEKQVEKAGVAGAGKDPG
eukprot:356438-Chlamydomonas_euryale.AAC.3